VTTARVDLTKVFFRIGEQSMRQAGLRIREGRGFKGPLAPKVRPDGRPVGYAGSSSGLSGAFQRGTLRIYPLGFTVRFDEDTLSGMRAFHAGRRPEGQVARPVFGMSGRARLEAREAVRDEVRDQLERELRAVRP
jgi:hypothetical protein